jgi:hypothetical protein
MAVMITMNAIVPLAKPPRNRSACGTDVGQQFLKQRTGLLF